MNINKKNLIIAALVIFIGLIVTFAFLSLNEEAKQREEEQAVRELEMRSRLARAKRAKKAKSKEESQLAENADGSDEPQVIQVKSDKLHASIGNFEDANKKIVWPKLPNKIDLISNFTSPPELTNEELVAGKIRITIDPIEAVLDLDESQSVEGVVKYTGSGKAYMQFGANRERVILLYEVDFSENSEKKLHLNIKIRNEAVQEDPSKYLITGTDSKNLRLYIEQDFIL